MSSKGKSTNVIKLETGVSRQRMATVGLPRHHTRGTQIINLLAPCCLPCRKVEAGGVVYHRQSDEAFPVAAVKTNGRHLLITFRAPDNPAKEHEDYPACNQFMAEPPSSDVRVLLPLKGTHYQPIDRKDDRTHLLLAVRDEI